jgi:amino acid adenylation domain-containing protein
MGTGNFAALQANLSPAKRALLELRLKEKSVESSVSPIIPITLTRDNAPLSFSQERLWFLNQLDPESPAYNESKALRLKGHIDVGALERALDTLVLRHEVLRSIIGTVDGIPRQVVNQSQSVELEHVELSGHSGGQREVQRVLREVTYRPFDLSKDLMLRAALLHRSDEEHVLLLATHHIASDGWSSNILFQEISVLYEAFSNGLPPSLPELSIQYADFASWQRDRLKGDFLKSHLSYWREQLQDTASVLELPTDRPRPAVQFRHGRRQRFDLSRAVSQRLRALCQKKEVTLFMLLLAAFQALLHRYTGQNNIIVGCPVANRTRVEVEGLIGFFVNTLILRANFGENLSFLELLSQVRRACLGAYSHSELPFEKLVEELQPERSLSHNPFFQVTFQLRNEPKRTLRLLGITVEEMDFDRGIAKFDLSLSMTDEGENLTGSFEYNTDLFDDTTIKRMVGHFQILLEGIVANPDQRISELPLLTEAEKHQLLIEWNDTKRDYPKDKCIHELFEEQVERSFDAIAVVFEDQQLTYGDLNTRANQLAHYLQKLGVGAETLVGICVQRSIEMIVGLLGILKAGGAYVPLDPSYPKERLGFMLEDTHAGIVLTNTASRNSLPPASARVICLDRDWEEVGRESQVNPISQSTADSLAYVIYTSGSMGVPKGVEVRHRGVVCLFFGVDYVQLDRAQTFLHLAPISFDAATFEVWGALLHGSKCVLFAEKVPSTKEIGEVLKKHQVTTLWLTAALFNSVINEEPQALSDVKQLLIGGEALSVPHVKKGIALLPNGEIINGYGPTESTTFTCCYPIPRQLNDNLSSIPIGKPIGNTQVYILDSHLNPVPIGVPGELHIGGDGLARGYLNRPELTEEKFIPNPFSDEPGTRLYRTGDVARYLPDGNIEFLGRIDNQVKIRGYRIELGEIESILSQHPFVREVVVLAPEDSPGVKQLVAYIVFNRGQVCTASEVRSFLRGKLPDYMVPSAFMFLESLPLTPSGKVDRKALPTPDQSRPELEETYTAPHSPTEEILVKIWAEVLKIEKVGIHDNFFDLGGHSLLATQVIARIREALQAELPLRVLFESPTIAALALRIEQSGSVGNKLQELACKLAEVELLSDDEAQRYLAERITWEKQD